MLNELSLLNSIFGDGAACSASCVPAVDIMENDAAYILEMDLPGRNENSVNIELNHSVLTISSKKEEKNVNEEKAEEKNKTSYLLCERRNKDFSRSFALPENVNEEGISASFKNGVLSITMNKKELAAPRRIAIEAA